MIRQLPIVRIEGKHYFMDERLHEYRETTNPHNRIGFAELGERKVEPVEVKKEQKLKPKRRLQ